MIYQFEIESGVDIKIVVDVVNVVSRVMNRYHVRHTNLRIVTKWTLVNLDVIYTSDNMNLFRLIVRRNLEKIL